MPAYWFDVFTPETWDEARAHDFMVSGFSQSKWATVKHVQPDDVLLCYLKGPTTLVGALRVTGQPYFSREPMIWKKQDFPSRVPVEPMVIFDADQSLDFRQLVMHLSFYNAANMRKTWARLQGSPTKLSDDDGAFLLAALQGSHAIPAIETPAESTSITADEMPSLLPSEHSALQPVALADPLETLVTELVAAQRDAAKPSRFEQAVANAFDFLGFDVMVYGQTGRTDMVLESPLGHDRFRVVIDAKASSGGKIPESQINWPAVAGHRQHEGADHSAVVGERFAGGNLHKFAADFAIALVDTESLIQILRMHAATPFPASDLRPLFSTAGPVAAVVADLKQKSQTTDRHWQLVSDIVRLIEGFSRLEQPPLPTAGNLHAVLVARALGTKGRGSSPPSEQDVRDALTFLACRAVGVLRPVDPETAGYRLAMSLHTALQRFRALEGSIHRLLSEAEDDSQPQPNIGTAR